MRLSLVLHAFLARTAVGTIVSLLVVMRMRAAERHVRFQTVLAAVLAAGAAALYLPGLGDSRPEFPSGGEAFFSLEGGMPGVLVLFTIACLAANVLFGTFRRGPARGALVAAVAVGIAAVLGTARLAMGPATVFGGTDLSSMSFAGPPSASVVSWRTLGGLLGGMAMGGVNDAMILGHFYLMIKGLPLEALKRTGIFAAAVVLVRAAFFAGLCAFSGDARDTLFGAQNVIWTSWRIAFGFLGPLVLIWMTRDALKYKHTQAATGILYVALALVLMGELAAVHLEFQTGFPV